MCTDTAFVFLRAPPFLMSLVMCYAVSSLSSTIEKTEEKVLARRQIEGCFIQTPYAPDYQQDLAQTRTNSTIIEGIQDFTTLELILSVSRRNVIKLQKLTLVFFLVNFCLLMWDITRYTILNEFI